MNSKTFPKIRDFLRNSIYDMRNFVADDELNVLGYGVVTLAAISSPMKSPSLILTGPGKNSNIGLVFGLC